MVTPDLLSLAREAIAQHEKATPGPWQWTIWDNGSGKSWELRYCGPDNLKLQGWDPTPFICSCGVPPQRDLEWIASAREREPLLARALLEMAEENERLREELCELKSNAVVMAEGFEANDRRVTADAIRRLFNLAPPPEGAPRAEESGKVKP